MEAMDQQRARCLGSRKCQCLHNLSSRCHADAQSVVIYVLKGEDQVRRRRAAAKSKPVGGATPRIFESDYRAEASLMLSCMGQARDKDAPILWT